MLGRDLMEELRKCGYDARGFDLPELDICDEDALKRVIQPESLIINCAAYTNVEKAESEPELAYKVNAEAVARLGKIAADMKSRVIHISTDFVFNGKSETPYTEDDEPDPVNVYGASKLEGEKLLKQSGCEHLIMRVQWTYGRHGSNFITKLLELAKTRDRLKVVDDQKGSPTSTIEAVKTICKLITLDRFPKGIFHFAALGYASRFEVARFIFVHAGSNVEIEPCDSSEFPTAAQRPLNSCFDCGKLTALVGEPARSWQEPLAEFIDSIV
ncbi:dTDP-4-dehydrorhamnose reductase [Anaerohalosphaera lusitana]|uniref:dTDP-4-dehydrorhamnose reductase n=2 Tax=Anaerohalosphaera lusitana TaxID=1936003 RepID=A0A1U9NP96_9BACT|nr:dTDP-4-dehydrorhamnose reductase [Anaerohalosphaera lusitana]